MQDPDMKTDESKALRVRALRIAAGRKGGEAGHGKAKKRGSRAFYAALGLAGAKARWKKSKEVRPDSEATPRGASAIGRPPKRR